MSWARYLIILALVTIFTFLLTFSETVVHHVRNLALPLLPKKHTNGTALGNSIDSPIFTHTPLEIEVNFPSPDPKLEKDYHYWNDVALRALHVCMVKKNCGRNQQKIVLLASDEFANGFLQKSVGGEAIWGASIHKHLRELGYTTLFSMEWDETLANYRMAPDLVKVVIRHRAGECHSDSRCVKSKENPTGIPAWKIFDLAYFPSHGDHEAATPLKGKWILSAVPDYTTKGESPIQYIGYSIEEECSEIPMVPFADRSDRAWLLMKLLRYVHDDAFAWNRSYFPTLVREMNVTFFGAWNTQRGDEQWGDIEDIEDRAHGITNLGQQLPQARFFEEVRLSKVMIGMGNPVVSPSPINGLCMGVPFINPIFDWSREDPQNKTHWSTQHNVLIPVDAPYVYHVQKKDFDGFQAALKSAMTTEIGRFTPSHMTSKAFQGRLTVLVETDWRAHAEQLLEDTLKANNGGYIFEL